MPSTLRNEIIRLSELIGPLFVESPEENGDPIHRYQDSGRHSPGSDFPRAHKKKTAEFSKALTGNPKKARESSDVAIRKDGADCTGQGSCYKGTQRVAPKSDSPPHDIASEDVEVKEMM